MNNNKSASSRHLPNLADRQAAEQKLCRFFASFGIDARAEQERLIDPFVTRAAHFWRGHAGLDFASLALDEAEADMADWFSKILSTDENSEPVSVMTGRAAFLMCGGPRHFADLLLIPVEDLPGDFIDAMQSHTPAAVPPSELGDMDHQPYEAWSVRHALAKAAPIDKSLLQTLGHVIRRDGRGFGFGWWHSGPSS